MNTFIIILSGIVALQPKLLTTPIFSFLPKLKLHHVVLLSNSPDKNIFKHTIINNIYSIDYTPLGDINKKIGLQLLLGNKMKGRVRVVHLNRINQTTLIDDWYDETNLNILPRIDDPCINNIIMKWDTTFHLYANNCQHFARYFITEIEKL